MTDAAETVALQYHLPLPLRAAMLAEDFLVTDSNRDAATWILKLAPSSWPSHCLILFGPRGCGKTHLLTAWTEKHKARRLDIGENALKEIVEGAATHRAFSVDDTDQIAGNAAHEEWLQHLYNATKASGLPLLLTAMTPPAAWGLALPDILSRLKSCAVAEIHQPDDALMRGMLVKQFADRQLLVDMDVIDYLVTRLERTGATIRDTVALLDKRSLEQARNITIPFAQQALLLRPAGD